MGGGETEGRGLGDGDRAETDIRRRELVATTTAAAVSAPLPFVAARWLTGCEDAACGGDCSTRPRTCTSDAPPAAAADRT